MKKLINKNKLSNNTYRYRLLIEKKLTVLKTFTLNLLLRLIKLCI